MNGQDVATAKELATHAFNRAVAEQAAIRAPMDYYELMVQGLFALIVLIIIFPDAKRKVVKFSKTFLPY